MGASAWDREEIGLELMSESPKRKKGGGGILSKASRSFEKQKTHDGKSETLDRPMVQPPSTKTLHRGGRVCTGVLRFILCLVVVRA